MQIFLFQNGEQQGPFTAEQLRSMQRMGGLALDALAWHEGQDGWLPLAQVIGAGAPGGSGSLPIQATEEAGIHIEHQESYSRGQLVLRAFLGWLYIGIPHGLPLYFLGLASAFCTFIAFWVILFTGRYPEGLRGFVVGVMQWQLRTGAAFSHLVDGYPQFGLGNRGDKVRSITVPPLEYSRGNILLRVFFGWLYILIPHGICLAFRGLASGIISVVALFIVLFTGAYPPGMHAFVVGTMRWGNRLGEYLMFLSNTYPPFSGKP